LRFTALSITLAEILAKNRHIIMKLHSLIPLALVCATACSAKIDNRGYVRQEPMKEKIVVGSTSKQEIIDRYGSPSSQSTFGNETWYYISNRKETVGFLKPEVVEQDVTKIEFDQAGMVSKVDNYDLNNAENVKMVNRETPTEGHQMNFLEQVLSNVGRFNKPGGTNGSVAGGRQANPGGL
jgi:outer membrane protein assembly factor BamE (lipoprotein component of BamABCDE complex)